MKQPRVEIVNEHEFNAALRRKINEVEDRTKDAVDDGTREIEREFERRAKKLTGAYSRSFVSAVDKQGDGKYEATFGPDVPYAGKQERANHTLEESMNAAESKIGNAFESAWRKGLT